MGVLLFPYVSPEFTAATKFAVAERPVKIPLIVKDERLFVNVTLSPIDTLPAKVVADVPEIDWLLVVNEYVPVPVTVIVPLLTMPF